MLPSSAFSALDPCFCSSLTSLKSGTTVAQLAKGFHFSLTIAMACPAQPTSESDNQPEPHETYSIRSLPDELLVCTFDHLAKVDLRRLRLVSKRIRGPASESLFRNLKTTVFGDPRFQYPISPLYHTPLARLVRTVYIDPCKYLGVVSCPSFSARA